MISTATGLMRVGWTRVSGGRLKHPDTGAVYLLKFAIIAEAQRANERSNQAAIKAGQDFKEFNPDEPGQFDRLFPPPDKVKRVRKSAKGRR